MEHLITLSEKYRSLTLVILFLVLVGTEAKSQFVYLEDFSLPSGTTVDTGDSPWTRDISATNLGFPDDRFEVRDNNGAGLLIFEAVDTDGEAVWRSGVTDISTLSSASISVDIAEAGNMENNDYLRISYILDGGAEVRFANFTNDFGATFQTVTSPTLVGSTLQVIVRVRNNRDNELHAFDNVAISGPGNTLFARQSANWNSLDAWSYQGPTGQSCTCFPDENSLVVIGSNHTIDITAFSEVNDLRIEDTGVLAWAADNELNVFNNGSINVQLGGLLDMSGFDFSQLDVAESAGNFRLIVNGTLIANDIDLNGSDATLDISGDGTINILKDLRFDFDRITLNNNFTGEFTLQGNILFAANNSTINNNGKMDVIGDVQFANAFAEVINQTINNTDSLIVRDVFVQEALSSINNLAGAYFNFRDIDVVNNFDLNIDNSGIVEMDGSFVNSTITSAFANRSGAEWRYEGTGLAPNVILNVEETGNDFIYQGVNQDIINPQNGYYNLTLANAGAKVPNQTLDILGDVNIVGDAQFDLATNSIDISIQGDFNIGSTNASPLLATSTTITFDGSTDQLIDAQGADFYNITLNKTGGELNMTSALDLNAALRWNSITDVNSNGNLRLVSTTDDNDLDNGRILTIPSGASVNGDVTVERFISGEGNIWRYVSSGIQGATVADWQDDVSITGRFDDPSNGPGVVRPNAASLYYYDETLSGSLLTGWTRYPTSGSAADNPLEIGLGYALFIYNGENTVTLDLTGPINQGTIDLNITYNDSGNPSEDGWNLLGNPYPSTIDWDNAAGWSRSGIANATYIRDNGQGAGIFATYLDGLGTNSGTSRIAAGQAFWVQALTSNPQVQINESAKIDEGRTFFGIEDPKRYVRLSLTDGELRDETIIRFKSAANMGFDPSEDAVKRSNTTFNLASYSQDSIIMAINAIPDFQCNQEVGLSIKSLKPGDYTITLDELVNVIGDFKVTLIDHYNETNIDIESAGSYDFIVSNDPLSVDEKRFSIVFEAEEPFNYPVKEINICEGHEITLPTVFGFTDYNVLVAGKVVDFVIDTDLIILNQEVLGGNSVISGNSVITLVAHSERCGTENSIEIPVTVEEAPEIAQIETEINCGTNSVAVQLFGSNSIEQIKIYRSKDDRTPIYVEEGLSFTFSENQWQDVYYIVAYNKLGCESARYSFKVEFPELYPKISQLNDTTLQSNYSQNIQWFKDGEELLGETSKILIVEESGQYSLRVRESGCEEYANREVAITPSIEEEELVTDLEDELTEPERLMVYPNPTSRFLNVPIDGLEIQHITVFDARGVLVYATQSPELSEGAGVHTIDLIEFPNGLYVIKVLSNTNELAFQFIKQ